MKSGSCRSKAPSENSAQQGDIFHLYALPSVSLIVAGFAVLLVRENETPNSDRYLIWLVCSGRLVCDVTEQRPCYAAVRSPENKVMCEKTDIRIGVTGLITAGDNAGWQVRIEDDMRNTGGFLVLLSPDFQSSPEGADDWVESESALSSYFEESSWVVKWL